MKSLLHLSFIPSKYWNETLSNFKLIDNGKELPKDADFFLLWALTDQSKEDIMDIISQTFPTVPVNKLRTCKINLALPLDKKYFKIQEIKGKIMPIPPGINLLYQLQILENKNQNIIIYSDSIKTYAFLTKFIFELLTRGSFLPILESYDKKKILGKWRLLLKTQGDNQRFKTIVKNCPWSAHNLPINFILKNNAKSKSSFYKTDSLWHPSFLFSYYLDTVGDNLIKITLNKSNFQALKQFYSTEIKKDKENYYDLAWDYKFLKTIIGKNDTFQVTRFHETILPKIIRNWSQFTQDLTYKLGFSLGFELSYPEESDENWLFKFLIIFQDSKVFSLKEFWNGNSTRIKPILDNNKREQLIEIVLRALGTASKLFPPINRALEEKFPNQIMLNSTEVMEFLKYPKDLLIQSGFTILLPEVFKMGGKHRLTAKLIITSENKKKSKGTSPTLPSLFNLNSLLEYKWEAILKGKVLTNQELKELINSPEPLINWRGEWILIEQNDINDLQEIIKKERFDGTISYINALKLGLTGNTKLQEFGTKYEVIIEGGFNEIIERVRSIDNYEKVSIPKKFNGKLRPYQQTALTWMANLCSLNFGVCLADDMGLGKTIEVISYLLYRKEKNPDENGSIIIICPTSVLFNWKREIEKFAPDLEIIVHHGIERIKDIKKISEFIKPHRIFLTTYGTLRNDINLLEKVSFSGIIVDEIQNIKNFNSKQTKAVYRLQGNYKIGLSGTPIENRLMELWSLFEFLNPSLLGKRTKFQENFIIPIERYQDQDAIEELKKLISPFILRRLKTDKSIIKDLPEKNEIKIYVGLSDIQAKIYKELVNETFQKLDNIFSNKMNVLTLLVKLKQVCNHPYQYLKKKVPSFKSGIKISDFISESQKMERLIEMIDEVISNGDKALVFTQFKQMGDIIVEILKQKYEFNILYFHGGVSEKKRRDLIDNFQSNDNNSTPIMVISLKAGGIGLNLTQATTVFHYDRWWNPAVENQATDRAYRIGQKSSVNVYKFIATGTIEEKIDLLLEEKRDLADKIIISSGESWISDLNIDKLKELLIFSN